MRTCNLIIIIFFSTYALQPSSLIVLSGLDVPSFATRRLHACHHARAPSSGRWNCGREMSGKICLNAEFHVTFRDLLHVIILRHGTDGFTSPPKEGVLRIFRPKNPTASAGCEPANVGTKGYLWTAEAGLTCNLTLILILFCCLVWFISSIIYGLTL